MVGERLRLVRDQVAHGKWNQWLKDNCPINPRTAKLYIQLADHRGVIDDQIAEDPTLSIRAVRRLIAKPIKPAAEEPDQAPDEAAGEEPEAPPPDPAADLLAMWKATAITDQKTILAAIFDTITLATAVNAMPKAWRDQLESRACRSLQAGCSQKERDTIRKLEKKRPYLELAATPIT
jgi:hypothetical protein